MDQFVTHHMTVSVPSLHLSWFHNWPIRALFLDRVDRAGGSSLSKSPSSSSPLATDLLFLLVGLDVTLMVIFGIELDVPNIKVLFATVESM